jgi:DNA-binding response OmpR family regulator
MGIEHIVETYAESLQDEYDVDTATSVAEALGVIDDDHDVVVIDRQLSREADVVVVDELQKRGVDCRIVLVLDEEPSESVLELGCTDYLVTPVDGQELTETVRRVLRIGEYVDRRRELGSKKLTRNVMEVEHSEHELADDESYRELNAEIERLEAVVDEIEAELGLEDIDRFL